MGFNDMANKLRAVCEVLMLVVFLSQQVITRTSYPRQIFISSSTSYLFTVVLKSLCVFVLHFSLAIVSFTSVARS